MGCSGVVQQALLQIHKEISGADEVRFELAAERAVQAGENARGIVGVSCLARESNLEHGSDQGGWHSVSSDVGDQNADALFIDAKEIVEIAGNGAHGDVARSNFESRERGDAVRKRGRLNPAGDFQLFVDGEESFFVREGTVRGHVSETRDENQETKKFHVVPGQDLKTHEICVQDEQKTYEKTRDENAHFAG